MVKVLLVVIVIVAAAAAWFVAPIGARGQSPLPPIAPGFEYTRVSNYVGARTGWTACVAAVDGWKCRDFPASAGVDSTPVMLSTLGNEGWELVSTVATDTSGFPTFAMFFKRPR